MTRRTLLLVALVFCQSLATALHGQTVRPITEAEARAAVTIAAKEARGSEWAFLSAYERELRKVSDHYRNTGIWMPAGTTLKLTATPAAAQLLYVALTKMRFREPFEDLEWPGGVVVRVEPVTLEAPNIVNIMLSRNGTMVEPIRRELTPRRLQTTAGELFELNAGYVVFPTEAFTPGARVVLTFSPTRGNSITKTFSDSELRTLQ